MMIKIMISTTEIIKLNLFVNLCQNNNNSLLKQDILW